MKKVITVFTVILIIIVIISTVSYYSFLDDQNKKTHESKWVKECIPKDNDKFIPSIGIQNSTHNFDLRTCEWSERK